MKLWDKLKELFRLNFRDQVSESFALRYKRLDILREARLRDDAKTPEEKEKHEKLRAKYHSEWHKMADAYEKEFL